MVDEPGGVIDRVAGFQYVELGYKITTAQFDKQVADPSSKDRRRETNGSTSKPGTAREHTTLSLKCPILTGSNYTIWAVKIKTIFKAHGVWEAIDPGVDIDQKKNSLAIAYLYQAIPEETCVTNRVQQARLGLLQTEFEALKMKEGETIEEFAGQIGEIVSKTNSLGGEIEEKKLVRKFLGAVLKRFLPIVASIEQFADLDTMLFQEVIGQLRAYEERIKPSLNNQGSKNDQQLLLSYEEWQAKKREQKGSGRGRGRRVGRGRDRGRGSSNNRGRGHDQDQNQSRGKDKSQIKCVKCDKLGHFALNCPTRHETANIVQDEGPALLMRVHSESKREVVFLNEEKVIPQNYNLSLDEDQTWFLDNGAIRQGSGGIEIKQAGYAMKLLKQAGVTECNATKLPMEPGLKLSKKDEGPDAMLRNTED
ncbi:hypothetical protein E3N88_04657 [Mikania micrantha]|uniref:CCHC-type domain-containing protein n=1 Tax=Mikania micrantha TaxID=192012 RepID=A0A5N6PV24_9ASTR|nr:hypothetical protein E3N88_04657 [Mikania micrantha]